MAIPALPDHDAAGNTSPNRSCRKHPFHGNIRHKTPHSSFHLLPSTSTLYIVVLFLLTLTQLSHIWGALICGNMLVNPAAALHGLPSFLPPQPCSGDSLQLLSSSGLEIANISTTKIAAFLAPLIAIVATGIPEGICTVLSRASMPLSAVALIGTPITGRVV